MAHPDRVQIADEQVRALEMKRRGATYRQIADELGVSVGCAYDRVTDAIKEIKHPIADEVRTLELERLDLALEHAMRILEGTHSAVSHGRVVRGDDGQPLPDHDMTLKAIDRITRLSETRRKLLGLDAPERVEQTTTLSSADPAVEALLQRGRRELT